MERSARAKENYMIELPSGRKLRYFRPSVVAGLTAETNNGRGITRRKWWGGSLAENLTQATARDVFSTAILRIEEELGLPVLFHVHDEITCLVKEEDAESALKDVLRIMCTPPDFMPDLPLNAEGHIVDSYPLK
jgi:DNA polymerase